jgi:hypothetical protein
MHLLGLLLLWWAWLLGLCLLHMAGWGCQMLWLLET